MSRHLFAINRAVDTLDAVAGDLLAVEASILVKPLLDADELEHAREGIRAARHRLMTLCEILHAERRRSVR